MQSLHHVDHPSFGPPHPISEIHIVGDSCTQHNQSYMFGKHDNGLLPNHSSFGVVDIVHLVKNDPLNVSYHLSPSVQIVPQYFCSHDHTACLRIHCDITSYYSHGIEFFRKLAILLIGECFDWGCVDYLSFVLQS